MPVIIQNLIEVVNIAVEMILIFLYFSLLSNRRCSNVMYFLSYVLVVSCLSFAVLYFDNTIIYFITTIGILIYTAFIVYSETVRKSILLILIYLLIISIADPLVIGILCVANVGMPEEFLQGSIGRYLGIIGTDIIYLWLISFTHRLIKKRIRDLPVKYWILIMIIPIFSIFILQFMIDSITLNAEHTNYVALGLAISGISYINITMFHFFESYENNIKLKYLERLQQQEQENYSMLALTHKQIREFKHDIENQFSVLHDMMESGKTEKALEYLDTLGGVVRHSNCLCHTGNNAVDSIVNTKGSLAQTYGIEFICRVNIISEIKADEMELCRILGNGLDNAIEACERLENVKKHILLSISEDKDNLYISISNTSDRVNTENLSTKKKTGMHGIGVNSIKSSVERLKGVVRFSYKDSIFKLHIVVPNGENV